MRYISWLVVTYLLVLYFDFVPQSFLLRRNGEMYVQLYHKVPTKYLDSLKVRVVTDVGLSYILDPSTNNWIYSNEFWTNQPNLNNRLKVKVKSAVSPLTMHFDILDPLTGTIYSTVSKKIWVDKRGNDIHQD